MSIKNIKLPSQKYVSGLPLTGGGSRRVKLIHRSAQLGMAITMFKQILEMKDILKGSSVPEPLKKKLMIDGRNMLENLIKDFQCRDEFMALPEVKVVYRSMKYRINKNKLTKEKYKTDEEFRERQKAKMKRWRENKANVERERLASNKRRKKAAKWKRFLKQTKTSI